MRLREFEQTLDELKMSPGSLKAMASQIEGALVGLEFEMVVPGIEDPDDTPDYEPDYDYDSRIRATTWSDFEQAIYDFYLSGEFSSSRGEVKRALESANEDLLGFIDDQFNTDTEDGGFEKWWEENEDGPAPKPEDGKFGSFSSDGRKITASTDAGLADEKGGVGPSYNRDAAGKGIASTGVHETMHAQWYNLENTPEYQENGLAAGMRKAVENSDGYKNRVESGEFGTSDKDKAFAAAMSPEEYAVIHGTRKFFADPLNKNRQLFEERNAVRRIKRGEGSLEDALRVQDMMYRYDRNQAAERGAAGAGTVKNSLRSDVDAAIKAELERPKVAVQSEFNLQPHNELSRWKEANFPEPSLKEREARRQAAEKAKLDKSEFKKWLQAQSKYSEAADEPVGVDNLMRSEEHTSELQSH